MITRHANVVRVLLAGLTAACCAPSFAQRSEPAGYPSKPMRVITNFPAGGPADSIARLLGNKLNAALGQPFVIESKPGAGGNIGADFVAKSAPDGYTLLMTIDTPLTVNPALFPSMPFKPGDLKSVAVIASSSLTFAVHPKIGVAAVAEFVKIAKTRELNFSSGGTGSPGHIASAMFAEATGIKVNHIMYKGNPAAVMAVVAGDVEAAIVATPGVLPFVQSGKLKALAVTSAKRSRSAPDVPTMAEAGVAGVEFEVLYLLMAPAATPAPIIATLQKEITTALAAPDVQDALHGADLAILNEAGAVADARLAKYRERYAATIKATGMKFE